MEGYLASIFVGIFLGLIGGGGSILTVPVLVYLFHIDTVLATAYSLFIVGITSLVGSRSYFKKGLVNIKTAIVFGSPSLVGIFLTRIYFVPAIPQEIFVVRNTIITKDMLLMLLFAALMVLASYSMVKKDKGLNGNIHHEQPLKYPQLFIQGIFVGTITGLVGAGGGFLIIPALVNLLKLPMKAAVGTSLMIISTNSLLGFLFSLPHISVQWFFLSGIAFAAVIGILIGSFLATKWSSTKLKPAFGWFVLVMGVYIIINEIVLK